MIAGRCQAVGATGPRRRRPRRAMSSSTTASKGWMPGARGPASEPVDRGERARRRSRSVARGQPELDRLARRHRSRRRASRASTPARTTATSSTVIGSSAAEDAGRSRGRVPDGRSAFVRRCHSTTDGSNPPIGAASRAASSTSRRNRAAPRARFGATTAAAPNARNGARDPVRVVVPAGRRDDEPAGTPAARATVRFEATASARDASTTTSAAGDPTSSCRPDGGRPSGRETVVAAFAGDERRSPAPAGRRRGS